VSTPHRVSPGYEAIDLALVAILLIAAVVIAQSGITAIRRHRRWRRAWLRDFEAEARERQEEDL
jgi:hypothetical protein